MAADPMAADPMAADQASADQVCVPVWTARWWNPGRKTY